MDKGNHNLQRNNSTEQSFPICCKLPWAPLKRIGLLQAGEIVQKKDPLQLGKILEAAVQNKFTMFVVYL